MKFVVWEGDTLEVLKSFPEDVRVNLGHDLRRLQEGLVPLDWKPMVSMGRGIFELRERDKSGQYRVIYYTKVAEVIYVLHCFKKKTQKTAPKDLALIKLRLKKLKGKLREGRDE